MNLRLVLVSALLSSVLAIASPLLPEEQPSFCGPRGEKYRIVKHKGEHPIPKPRPDKALIYVIGWWHAVGGGGEGVALNGKWVAKVGKRTYTYIEADPGLLKFCKQHGKPSPYLFLTVEGGKVYYLRISLPDLLQLENSEGERLLGKCQFVTMEPKH